MKVEAICTNAENTCPTFDDLSKRRQVQLLEAFAVAPNGVTALDEDGNMLYCPWCYSPVLVRNVARESAQFPLGNLEVTDAAKGILSWNHPVDEDPLAWMEVGRNFIDRHAQCDFGAVEDQDRSLNMQNVTVNNGLAGGRVMSLFQYRGSPLLVITERDRHQTTILTPDDVARLYN